MNVGVVLDLRNQVGSRAAPQIRALLEAFTKARDIGDRFALVVAGRAGGAMVEPEEFRHGPVTVAMQKLFDGRFADESDPTFSLQQALATAYAKVGQSDDPTSPLGSSVVVLVTDQSLGSDFGVIERTAHQRAVDGIPMSVIGVGAPDVALMQEIDRLVLAGQGNRRLLNSPNDATALVQRELSAVSRVVARAVRLRIRLAPGVKLIDVLGSHRLDEARAEQVRKAEKSIDLRMSRNLGIEADRGEDEEGIQIVIPSFYAGDSHVFLLDVVAEGPGPIADVTVRYKDLVFLKNGVARDNLTLERRTLARGPLERNVLKNLLGYELSGTLAEASEALARGDNQAALAAVTEVRALIAGVRREIPGMFPDRDLINDGRMLDEYAQLLGSDAVRQTTGRAHLTDSLRFAGRLKLLPRPEQD